MKNTNGSSATQTFLQGCKVGIPIAIGYFPIGIAFGLLVKSVGIPEQIAILLSLMVFAGASQFMALQMLVAGVHIVEIVFTTFILNLRHLLMSASLVKRIEPINQMWRFLLGFGVTDETFSVASLQKSKYLGKRFILGIMLVAYILWNIGTWIGLGVSNSIPVPLQQSMGIALYAMFVGLLIPSLRTSWRVLVVVSVAVAVHLLLFGLDLFPDGWRIIIATISGAAVGALLGDEDDDQ